MQGDVVGVAYFITGNEQTQLNRVCYFRFFGICLAAIGSNYSDFYYYFVSCAGELGPVVQSIVSLMSPLSGQLVKFFTT